MQSLLSFYSKPICDIIRCRNSWRKYNGQLLDAAILAKLEVFISSLEPGPFGNRARFSLVAADDKDNSSLKSLGTYGFIHGAKCFLIGAIAKTDQSRYLEDYGFAMEQIILYATDLGLASCWLGGTFNKSSFAEKIRARENEIVPAVSPIGYRSPSRGAIDQIVRFTAGSHHRLPFEKIFFDQQWEQPLSQHNASDYTLALEMVRLAPSASNKQPWRVVVDKKNQQCHFYLKRSPGYRNTQWLVDAVDLQRIDMGIAIAHFYLAMQTNLNEIDQNKANIIKKTGGFCVLPDGSLSNEAIDAEYIASWCS